MPQTILIPTTEEEWEEYVKVDPTSGQYKIMKQCFFAGSLVTFSFFTKHLPKINNEDLASKVIDQEFRSVITTLEKLV